MPSDFPWVRISECCDLIVDCVNKTAPVVYATTPYKMIRTTNVRNGFIDISDCRYVDEDTFRKWTRRATLQDGDVVLTREAPIGQVGLVRGNNSIFLGQRLMQYRANREVLEPRYLCYAFLSPQLQHQFGSHEGSGSVVSHIRVGDCSNFKIPLPPLSEQRRVADTLSSLDERRLLLGRESQTLEQISNAVFKSWFIDFDPVRAKAEGREPEGMSAEIAALFPGEFVDSELGPIPKGWRVVRFLDACDLLGGSQPPASTFIDHEKDGYVRLLQIRDFSSDAHLTYIPDSPRLKKVHEDDVLIGRYGSASGDSSKDSLGRVCRGLSGAYNVALMKLHPLLIGRELALQFVSHPSFYSYLQGVSAKAVQSGFSKSELGQLKIVIPPVDLALVFEDLGGDVWQRIKAANKQIRLLAEVRDSLLPRLLSGKLNLPYDLVST